MDYVNNVKPRREMTEEERAEFDARLQAVRSQIVAGWQTRDTKALAKERAWMRKYGNK